MIITFKNCKHCGCTYKYQASGEGCLDELNDNEYCPICKKAIIDALNNIPIKFVEKWKLVDDINYEDLEILKKEYNNNNNNFKLTKLVSLNNINNNQVEQFFKNSKFYQVEWNTNNPSLKEIYCMYSYNIIEKCFTNKEWIYYNENPRFINCGYFDFKKYGKNIKAKPLNEPTGNLYYEEWDVTLKK